MTIHVCKSCGRAVKMEQKPNFCYADRTTNLENISDEDSIKMGLFQHPEKAATLFFGSDLIIEFPGDFKYNPISGDVLSEVFVIKGYTLSEFQNEIMNKVI